MLMCSFGHWFQLDFTLSYVPMTYLKIIPRERVGYEMVEADEERSAELVIIISYPTSASGINVLLNTPTKYREFFPTLLVKTTDF